MARGQGQGHKKIRGQGQGDIFRGQTLSRPRTGMLEVKDHGHNAEVFSKKKKKRSSLKIRKFSGVLLDQTNIANDLGPFSTTQKIVLSSNRGQGVFEGLQASRPRLRTSNFVLKDSTFANLSKIKLINQKITLKNGQKLVLNFDRLLTNA